ncbi:hypothetical protein ABES58_15500 [Paenibacillus lautus]|uniref:hypothetical protein n=1 Tax=Paenibacillus lautus TaxID=1401 RepID=UPI003D2D99D8
MLDLIEDPYIYFIGIPIERISPLVCDQTGLPCRAEYIGRIKEHEERLTQLWSKQVGPDELVYLYPMEGKYF